MTTAHPSDEQLSAHLDGEAPDVAPHVETCAPCQARLADLRAVAALLAVPPEAPEPTQREAAIAAARDGHAAYGPNRQRRLVLAVAAAVVVAAGIATPLLLGGGRRTTTALSSEKVTTAAGSSRADVGAALVDGGDLGDQTDAAHVGAIVARTLAPPGAAAPAPATGSGGSLAGGPAAASRTGGASACTPPAGVGTVTYRATLRWRGTPAEAFAAEPGRRLLIMDVARCQVLVDQRF